MDTSVLVAGVRSQSGASYALLDLVADRRVTALATPPLFLEYEDVLKRPEQRLAHRHMHDDNDRVLTALAMVLEPVTIYFRWRPLLHDMDDDMVLEAAINGHADALVTHNVTDFADVAPRFGISVLRPAELLMRMRL